MHRSDSETRQTESGRSTSDAGLLRRYLAERAEDAFAALVRRHLNLVYGAALRRTGNAAWAEEVAQEVFTSLARKAAALVHHETLAGWLFTATRFAAAQKMRAEQARQRWEQESYLMNTLSAGETASEWERIRPVIDEALEGLSPRDREAVLLRFFEGQAFAAIGTTLRVSEDAARMRVERALEKLRGLLARRGVTSTTVALASVLPAITSAAAPVTLAGAITSSALAAAAGSAGALASAGVFMGVAKLGLGVAAVLVASSLAVKEVHGRRIAEETVAQVSRDNALMRARLQAPPPTVAAMESSRADPIQPIAREASTSSHSLTVTETMLVNETKAFPVKITAAVAAGKALMARHPEVREAFVRWNAATFERAWAPFYKSEGLTPAQIDRFHELKGGENSLAMETQEDDMTTDSIALHVGSGLSKEKTAEALRDLLGADGYRRYLEFERTNEMRGVAAKMAEALAFTDTPLTTAQAEQMIRLLDAHGVEQPELHLRRFDWDAVAMKAQGMLAPPQLAALDSLRAESRLVESSRRKQNAAANPASR